MSPKLNARDKPTVSVVMSVYNGGEFLQAAIDSILYQTYTNFEFIIINDGSTDDSLSIIKSYKHKAIRVIDQKNHGLVYSLNKGIGLAKGDYIARQDADDISLPTRLEKEVRWLDASNKNALVSTYFSLIDFKSGNQIGTTLVFPVNNIDLKRALYITNPFAHGAAMFSRKVFQELGMYSSAYGPTEDYQLWTRLSQNWNVGLVPESLYLYRINNPESISQQSTKQQEDFVLKIREELWRRPFISKRPLEMVKDFRKIPNQVPNLHQAAVRDEYRSHQFAISKELLIRGKLKKATVQLAGTMFVYPKGFFILMRYLPASIAAAIRGQNSKRRPR